MLGPRICTHVTDVYVFRRIGAEPVADGVQFLQLCRKHGAMAGTWQPVMGHIEQGETALDAAIRELEEETGFQPRKDLATTAGLAFWQLETVNTYFTAQHDCIMLSPCFAAEVLSNSEPILDVAHCGHRWVDRDHVDRHFIWPGQRAAIRHILRDLVPADSQIAALLQVDLRGR